ncbi:hypothetical protein DSL72_005301 [Monilinia vaccinii-corymbosi]|uniref:ribonuclease H n=1 Tax=Monilinia vaccinii-corymbosi TaxID=61207 RepID=A0A8A3PF72_9HELO|nr:hypothetical protein DSL72_005301 [Monilinia vaccinii-corymbosi]
MMEKYLARERRRDQERSLEERKIFSRKFDLHQYFSPASRNTQRFIHHNKSEGYSMVHNAVEMSGDPKTLVVAVHGACPHNGSPLVTKSSFGLFFGEGSNLNMYEQISRPAGQVHTNSHAELMAVYHALHLIDDSSLLDKWRARNGEILTAIIMTDSAYVYDIFTTWIWEWRDSNFTASNTYPAADRAWIERIDKLIEDLKNRNIHIRFWSVPREDIEGADKLANAALVDGPIGVQGEPFIGDIY